MMSGGTGQNLSNNPMNQQQLVYQGGQNQAPKQRLKSATMNKRLQRGFSRDHQDDGTSNGQYEEVNNQYHNYTGHLSNTGMPPVGGAQGRKKWTGIKYGTEIGNEQTAARQGEESNWLLISDRQACNK